MTRSLVATLLTATLACQMLVAGRAACVASPHAGMESSTTPPAHVTRRAVSGMDMATTPIGSAALSSEGLTQCGRVDDPPCDQPTGAASCLLMAPCTPSFVVVPPAALGADLRVATHVVPTRALEPPSQTAAPEFPPPRASSPHS